MGPVVKPEQEGAHKKLSKLYSTIDDSFQLELKMP